MEIVSSEKSLHLRVRDRQRILTAIPLSRPMGEDHVFVKWDLENSRRLNNLRIKNTPSPIRRDYNWPGKFAPYAHQRETAEFLTLNNRSFCFSEQGTGKTAAAIWAADYLMNIGDVTRVLIVCPVSVMQSAWADDLFSLVMHRTTAIAHGTRKKREKVLAEDYDFVIINYDGLHTVETHLYNKFDLIIADECNFVKTATTRRWKAFRRLVTPGTKLWLMTGTPAAQSPLDAYGIAKLVNPNLVPRYFGAWRDMVMIRTSPWQWMPKKNATMLVNIALQPAIRFTKSECLDLPPVTYQTRTVNLTPTQWHCYEEIKNEKFMHVEGGKGVSAIHAAAAMTKLLQVSCGAVYSDSGDVVEVDCKNRLREVVDIVNGTLNKVVVFVPFRHAITILADKLKSEGINTEIVNGAVTARKRADIFHAFQTTDDPRVLVIQPQSAAHGITLTAADTIVWFGPIASVETWLQANERINRPPQKNKMTIIKICGSPIEKRVYKALESKESQHRMLTRIYEEERDDSGY